MGCNVFSSEILAAWALLDSARFLCRSACKQRTWLCSQVCCKLAVNCPSTFTSLSDGHSSVLLHVCVSRAGATGLGESMKKDPADHWPLQRSFLTCRFALPVCTAGTWGGWQESTWPCQRLKCYGLWFKHLYEGLLPIIEKVHDEAAPPKPTLDGLLTENLNCELNHLRPLFIIK